jgi:hypothetical protein
MATYKMIQDIEAEDHIIGPLSLRQFIFALISAFLLYINFLCLTKHVGFLLIVFLPPALFTGFFAFPFGGDQPTEVWALAKIRFLFKPRKRIWDQSGVKELVTITVPKKIERNLTNGLSQNEVKSRLSALANTIDSRGWAVKNVNINLYANPGSVEEVSDRLVDISSLPREVASSQAHHQQLINQMNAAAPAQSAAPSLAAPTAPADYWFLNQNPQPVALPADQAVFNSPSVIAPGAVTSPLQPVAASAATDLSEEAFLAKVRTDEANEQITNSHLHTLQPLGSQPMSRTPVAASAPAPPPVYVPATPSPEPVDTAILSLARNNDLSIATLARESAREAQKSKHDESTDGEVVISLR